MHTRELQERIRRCRLCSSLLELRYVDPTTEMEPLRARPVVDRMRRAPVMLVGQAPGLEEYRSGRPFRGGAGREIRRIFERQGISPQMFDRLVYQTTVTKCFPGRRLVGVGVEASVRDRTPTGAEVRNCTPFLLEEIRLIRPRVIVLMGSSAVATYESLRGRPYKGDLRSYVGRTERWGGTTVVFMPHTSGTSRWLNASEVRNRRLFKEAQRQLKAALRRARLVP
jgi:uracil-DNA glycosylase